MAKVLEVAHILSFYPSGIENELTFSGSEIQADFQHCHIWT